jgi:hypothetical protein
MDAELLMDASAYDNIYLYFYVLLNRGSRGGGPEFVLRI